MMEANNMSLCFTTIVDRPFKGNYYGDTETSDSPIIICIYTYTSPPHNDRKTTF